MMTVDVLWESLIRKDLVLLSLLLPEDFKSRKYYFTYCSKDENVNSVIDIIKEKCRSRKQITASHTVYGSCSYIPYPVEVEVEERYICTKRREFEKYNWGI